MVCLPQVKPGRACRFNIPARWLAKPRFGPGALDTLCLSGKLARPEWAIARQNRPVISPLLDGHRTQQQPCRIILGLISFSTVGKVLIFTV